MPVWNISNDFTASSSTAAFNGLANMGGNMELVAVMVLASFILIALYTTIRRFRWVVMGAIAITMTCGPVAAAIAFSKNTIDKAQAGNPLTLYITISAAAFILVSVYLGRFIDRNWGDKIDAWFNSPPLFAEARCSRD